MILRMKLKILGSMAAMLLTGNQLGGQAESGRFAWPEGKRVAVSFSFDDARASQVDVGVPLFDKFGVKVTFYVTPGNMEKRLDAWKGAAKKGHEIGNHSGQHPCTGNFSWSRTRGLEEYTLEKMRSELAGANAAIEELAGVKPATFAYPCGQKFVGRGVETRSYIPLVAELFLAGRGFRDEVANDPSYCDLAQIMGIDSDGLSFDRMRAIVEGERERGAWVVFAGHDIGKPGRQVTEAAALEQFLKYTQDPANGVWLGTIDRVARHIRSQRGR
jgi:peptidoglycan/xylan/chitin deacetylase (PgdA/CDA1 family)